MTGAARAIGIGLATAIVSLGLTAISAPSHAASTSEWCWSMQTGNVRGTFTTTGQATGDGTAPAGTYTLTDASVYSSTYPEIELGSIANAMYAFETQPEYRFNWSGSAVTQFSRASGVYTNGFSIANGTGGSGAYLTFDVNYQRAMTRYSGGSVIFTGSVTPTLTPAPAAGCNPQSAPDASSGGSSASSVPVSTIRLDPTPGTSCATGPAPAAHGTWVSLPTADDCRRTDSGKSASTLLGWSTTPDFPVEIARNQVAMGWGTHDGPIDGQQMIFIPAGRSTLVSGDTALFPIWSSTT